MKRNFTDSNKVEKLIDPVSQGANVNSPAIDLKDADEACIMVHAGATVDPGATAAIEESEEETTGFAIIPGSSPKTIVANQVQLFEIDARLRKRYVRLALVCPGATLISATHTISSSREEPVTQPSTTVVEEKFRVDP